MEKNFSALQITGMAIRPKTLPAALAPVFIGSVLAWKAGVFHGLSASLALGGALLIQIGTNLANDYFDFQKGADTEERVGPSASDSIGFSGSLQGEACFYSSVSSCVYSESLFDGTRRMAHCLHWRIFYCFRNIVYGGALSFRLFGFRGSFCFYFFWAGGGGGGRIMSKL
jgi:hypothetical protein